MIVDDESANCKLLVKALASQYETITLHSGKECLDYLTHDQPEIILLDVMMPGLNGHEVCSQIKKNEATKNISVVFISALDTLDDRLNGYNAGGDDYLGKSVDLSTLLNKIQLILNNKKENQKLAEDVEEMQSGFMTALNMGAETDQVTNFIEQCLVAKNYDQLLNAFFESMQGFNLKTVAQIRSKDEVLTINSSWKSLPLEQELMLKAQFDGRILEFDQRMFINYESFSLLVKNSPIEDPDLVGRLRDHLAVIANACDFRIKAIGTEINLQSHLEIASFFKKTTQSIEKINKGLDADNKKAISISHSLGQRIEEKLIFLGLEEDQEKILMEIIDTSTNDLSLLMEKQSEIKDTLGDIVQQMNQTLGKI